MMAAWRCLLYIGHPDEKAAWWKLRGLSMESDCSLQLIHNSLSLSSSFTTQSFVWWHLAHFAQKGFASRHLVVVWSRDWHFVHRKIVMYSLIPHLINPIGILFAWSKIRAWRFSVSITRLELGPSFDFKTRTIRNLGSS